MTANESTTGIEDASPSVTTVAQTVLSKFFDELSKIEGFSEISPKLRKMVLDDGVFAEPSIRAALFPDAT